eukprot:322111_1
MKLFDKLSKVSKDAYLALICCMLIRAATGLTYIFANLLPYIASYIASKHGNNENTYDYYTVKCSWLYTAFIVPCSGIVVFAGKMEQKFGMRPTTILGFILMNIGISASYFVCHSFWGMLVFYGILNGMGVGIIYTMPILCVMRWFPNNKGLVNGLVAFAFGTSGIIFNPLSTYIINPKNIPIDPDTGFLYQNDVLNNIPSYFWKISLIYSFIAFLSMFYFKNPPSWNQNMEADLIPNENEDKNQDKEKLIISNEKEKLIISNASDFSIVCSWLFMNLWFTFLLNMITAPYVNSQWKEFNNQYLGITDDRLLS